MKPWREIAIPHQDVLEGTFQQSEFAADISAVRDGKASREYQDAVAFFQRTFITEGMRFLLLQVAKRLNGKGGEPIIQLQTAFGGGKTHTLLAVYHLAKRKCQLSDLVGISGLLDQAGLIDIPHATVAVLDGNSIAPGQPWKHEKTTIRTLWGELAWQLGGEDGFLLLKESDISGTSPGKEILKTLLERYSPCVILIDELVAYIRQFQEDQSLTGGSYDSNMSFMQALTEACKLVPNSILLASLPESEIEAGSQRGVVTLKALEKTFGRIQALWKPVATEEAFEIVRRRLFEPIHDEKGKKIVCRAFADSYISEGNKLPGETQESRYFDRLMHAYPIHPEVFDRLYEDWTTIDGFQRTRGVLKLMAKVIYRLWKDDNRDLLIMPGSLPLYDADSRNELVYYLSAGWDAVLEKDIDGDRAETTELETKEPRFGAVNAARRVARTIFLGSAPSSLGTKAGIRGLDRGRILLGCVQPGQISVTFTDAIARLADRLHYLNSSGDKNNDMTRFWFDTRSNLRREMEERKKRFNDKSELQRKLGEIFKKLIGGNSFFDGVHIFTPHSDVPDDSTLRLIFLPPEYFFTRKEPQITNEAVQDYIRNNGTKPRFRSNRLLFISADQSSISRMYDCIRTAMAWNSIMEDVAEGRLNIDLLQKKQAERELHSANDVLPRVVRECYKWLLCPVQQKPTDSKVEVEAFPLNTSGQSLNQEIERVCIDNELVITKWSPIHLRENLREIYWTNDKVAVEAMNFWEDTLRYLYLPRLKNRSVLEQAIVDGASLEGFFGTALAQKEGKYEGFKFCDANVQLDNTLLLIEPETAKNYKLLHDGTVKQAEYNNGEVQSGSQNNNNDKTLPQSGGVSGTSTPANSRAHVYIGVADVIASTAKVRFIHIAEEIVNILTSDPQANVKVTVEIHAEFPDGVKDHIKRAVSENSRTLGFKNSEWE